MTHLPDEPPLTEPIIHALPKVVLHDHLDGGLRPATLLELAEDVGYRLPADDPDELAAWFVAAADSGSLARYLETFDHTVAVMQTREGLRRVARDAVVDLAADGVVYAEQRYAPEQHTRRGLSLQEVVDAVQEGFAEGIADAAQMGRPILVGTLVTAMRHGDRSLEVADLALANRERGVVGFDIAGGEIGNPARNHRAAFELLRENLFPATIHAGEAVGVESIDDALQMGAARVGHGVRIMDDIDLEEGAPLVTARLGRVAQWVRDRQIPLEIAPTSNIQTGAAASIASHPITLLRDLGFAVTLNTDNRLMSGTSLSREMTLLAAEAGWGLDDLEQVTLQAAWAAFAHRPEMEQIVVDQILPGFEAVRGPAS